MPGEPARKVRVEQGKVEQARFTLARDVNSCFLPQRTQRCAEVFAQIRALYLTVLTLFAAWRETLMGIDLRAFSQLGENSLDKCTGVCIFCNDRNGGRHEEARPGSAEIYPSLG